VDKHAALRAATGVRLTGAQAFRVRRQGPIGTVNL